MQLKSKRVRTQKAMTCVTVVEGMKTQPNGQSRRESRTHTCTHAHTHTHNAGANVTRTLWKFERHAALHSDTQDVLGNIEVHAGAWDQRDGSEEE